VLALSHERKVRTVMNDAGVPHYCADLSNATAEGTMAMLRALIGDLDSCAERMREYGARASDAVVRQEASLPRLIKRAR